MRSLQRRIVLGGVLWAVVSMLIGGFALTSVFDAIADQRFNDTLRERHLQALIALGSSQSPEQIEEILTEPAYARTYSGRYWQVTDASGASYTSPSLFDFELPRETATSGLAEIWEGSGPNGPLRGLRETITLDDGTVWTVSVAASLNRLAGERAAMRRSVAVSFGFVGLLGVAGAVLLTSVLVAPIRKLSRDVVHRWDQGKDLEPSDYPTEVAPLVADINDLIGRNRDILDRGRRQAADLAHALKTPSAALRNELERFGTRVEGTDPMLEALDRIDAQIARSLARIRASNAASGVHLTTDVGTAVSRIERLFRSLPDTRDKEFHVLSDSVNVTMDAQDLEEILGNLLENAFKWCASTVRLSVGRAGEFACLRIEDDGPGIAEAQRQKVLLEGARLDTSVPGTGLGLSIANDLAQAYGGHLDLTVSETLGGLRVDLRIPAIQEAPARTVSQLLRE